MIRKVIAPVFASLILAVLCTILLNHFAEPPKASASSQFANIICDNFKPVSITANTQVITAGNGNMFLYVCSYNLNASAADAFSFVEGTGTTCATNTAAVVGSTTGANGLSLAANGTVNYGGGSGAVAKTAVAGDNICIFVSTAATLSGVVGWTTMAF